MISEFSTAIPHFALTYSTNYDWKDEQEITTTALTEGEGGSHWSTWFTWAVEWVAKNIPSK